MIVLILIAVGGSPAQASQQSDWAELICQEAYTWPCDEAMRVMWCESSSNPRAYSTGNRGLFQINEIHSRRVGGNLELLWDPEVNVRVAHDIWVDQGWRPWGCKP